MTRDSRPRDPYAGRPGALDVDRAFYHRLAERIDDRTLLSRFVVPIRSGKAWVVDAGDLCRIVSIEGPQVGDFTVWSRHNPREHLWSGRSKQLQRAHVTTYDRLWSCLPYLRPLLTITKETVNYGLDEDGAGCHDLLGTWCDPYVNKLLMDVEGFDYFCHSNLVRAIAPYRLTEFDVHDVLNMFQVTGVANDRYFIKPCPAKKGDFFEFLAETDLLCALSTCPFGDETEMEWGSAGPPIANCRPLAVEVYRPAPGHLNGWTPSRPVNYRGLHGLRPLR
jgi:uncharacterized protein